MNLPGLEYCTHHNSTPLSQLSPAILLLPVWRWPPRPGSVHRFSQRTSPLPARNPLHRLQQLAFSARELMVRGSLDGQHWQRQQESVSFPLHRGCEVRILLSLAGCLLARNGQGWHLILSGRDSGRALYLQWLGTEMSAQFTQRNIEIDTRQQLYAD